MLLDTNHRPFPTLGIPISAVSILMLPDLVEEYLGLAVLLLPLTYRVLCLVLLHYRSDGSICRYWPVWCAVDSIPAPESTQHFTVRLKTVLIGMSHLVNSRIPSSLFSYSGIVLKAAQLSNLVTIRLVALCSTLPSQRVSVRFPTSVFALYPSPPRSLTSSIITSTPDLFFNFLFNREV